MKSLKRYRTHLLAAAILIVLVLFGVRTKMSQVTHGASELPRVQKPAQRHQALELLPTQKAGLSLNSEFSSDQRRTILALVTKALPESQKNKAYEIARAVISEANHQHMDPYFLLAVIHTESQFNFQGRGTHGEIGLMQVMPKTATWLAPKAGLPSNFNLEDPATNIRLGAAYMAKLRLNFKRQGRRYIAAYNMGSKNVRRLLSKKTEPNLYPDRVMGNYEHIYSDLGTAAQEITPNGIASAE